MASSDRKNLPRSGRCPDEASLVALVQGRLSELLASPIRKHVDFCSACQSAVAELARTLLPRSAPPSVSAEPGANSVLAGRYRLEYPLGVGGTGVVWKAIRVDDGVGVAIKILKAGGAELALRLRREAALTRAVSHPGLVSVHEVIEAGPRSLPALVLDWLEGEDLAERLRRIAMFDPVQAARLLLEPIDALLLLHERSIVHRDLKPSNIFIARDFVRGEIAKLVDLGMARSLDVADARGRLTDSGVALGTPRYMAPEQLIAARDVDARADIWALGAILYEMLTGRPFRLREVGPPPALGSGTGDLGALPPSLAELIHSALAPVREQRPTLSAFRTVLGGLVAP